MSALTLQLSAYDPDATFTDIRTVKYSDLTYSCLYQFRAVNDEKRIEILYESILERVDEGLEPLINPIAVADIDGKLTIVDGFHRYGGICQYNHAQQADIPFNIVVVGHTAEEANLYAMQANSKADVMPRNPVTCKLSAEAAAQYLREKLVDNDNRIWSVDYRQVMQVARVGRTTAVAVTSRINADIKALRDKAIRKALKAGQTYRDIEEEYGVTRPTIASIKEDPEFGKKVSERHNFTKTEDPEFAGKVSERHNSSKTEDPEFAGKRSQRPNSSKTSDPEFGKKVSERHNLSKTSDPEFGKKRSQRPNFTKAADQGTGIKQQRINSSGSQPEHKTFEQTMRSNVNIKRRAEADMAVTPRPYTAEELEALDWLDREFGDIAEDFFDEDEPTPYDDFTEAGGLFLDDLKAMVRRFNDEHTGYAKTELRDIRLICERVFVPPMDDPYGIKDQLDEQMALVKHFDEERRKADEEQAALLKGSISFEQYMAEREAREAREKEEEEKEV